MKRFIKLLATFALAAVIGFSFVACGDDDENGKKPDPNKTSGNQLPGGTLISNTNTGNRYLYSDYYGHRIGYELYRLSGQCNIRIYGKDQGGGSAFRGEWTSVNDYLGRVGWFWDEGKSYDEYGDLKCDFEYVRSANGTAGNYSYIGLYGWSRNSTASNNNDKLIEYYIVEDWFGEGILGTNTMGGGATEKGSYTLDGATYKFYKATRTNQPSIEGTKTFTQYFSVRQARRQSGTISIKEHFDKWEEIQDISLGDDIYECKFLVEAGGGTGWFDAKKIKFYIEDGQAGPVYGVQQDGSYKFDPRGFSVWYAVTVKGDTVTFTNKDCGVRYDYPSGFNIKNYGSLDIVYTVSGLSNETPPTGKDGGAAIVVKVYDDRALGSNGYYGNDVKYTTLSEDDEETFTINDQNNGNNNTGTFAARWHITNPRGFAISINKSDTNQTFAITFHSITFKPPAP